MRTVPFQKIIRRMALKCGITPDSEDYTEELIELLVEGLNTGLQSAWKAARWPDACLVEERQFAADWDASETYAEGDIVYHDDQYYVALQASTNEDPTTATTYWEVTSDYDVFIDREQAWEDNEIGEFLTFTDRDPRKSQIPFYYLASIVHDGAWLTATCSGSTVWVYFRKVCPRFGWAEWADDETYAAGDLVIGSDEECYKCVAASTGSDPTTDATHAYWVKVEFPESFERWAMHYAKAVYLRDDGQDDKATAEEESAEWALQELSLEVFGGQDQQESPVRMGGYGVKAGRR